MFQFLLLALILFKVFENQLVLETISSFIFAVGLSLLIYVLIIKNKEKKEREIKDKQEKEKEFKKESEERAKKIQLARQEKEKEFKEMLKSKNDINSQKLEISGYRTITTFLKGIKYYPNADYCEVGDEIAIIHNPSKRFPENTEIYSAIDKIGTLKKRTCL